MMGFIVIDKPSGVTSFSMVSLVRRLTRVRRVGHAGTLDPLASGVLPVAVGAAARFIEYLDDAPKVYLATMRLGVSTDTYDAEGAVTAERDASTVSRADVESALGGFVGDIEQTPPVYSAIKVAGKPLYRYAREGAEVELAPRRVRIDSIVLRSFGDSIAEFEVACGRGTYIRSLAHDAGEALGCGAHLVALRRTASGGFSVDHALAPEELERLHREGRIEGTLLAPDRAVERRAAAILGDDTARDLSQGRDVALVASRAADLCRAYSLDGRFLGILKARTDGLWHPEKLLPEG